LLVVIVLVVVVATVALVVVVATVALVVVVPTVALVVVVPTVALVVVVPPVALVVVVPTVALVVVVPTVALVVVLGTVALVVVLRVRRVNHGNPPPEPDWAVVCDAIDRITTTIDRNIVLRIATKMPVLLTGSQQESDRLLITVDDDEVRQ
jgi:hypothetical protein